MVMVPDLNRADYSLADPAPQALRLEIPAECAGMRLDQALARMLPEHSRNRLQQWIRAGRVLVDARPGDAKQKVWGGERVSVEAAPLPEETAQRAEEIPLSILFEDASLLVIDKPAGLVVHPGSGNWSGTLLNALLHHATQLQGLPRAGIVHRLDKDTSGLLVVAKTLQAQTDLVRQLQARTVKRHYLSLVHGVVARDGTVDAPIGRHPVQRTRMAVVTRGRAARTHYFVREHFADATLLECALETGRTHQIRVHMDSIAHPLVGDPTYGRRRSRNPLLAAFPRQALHAWRLELVHPATGRLLGWEAPLPPDFSQLLDALRQQE
jgi:23S rRNA pseudouridine1911/1915/1917 synthase